MQLISKRSGRQQLLNALRTLCLRAKDISMPKPTDGDPVVSFREVMLTSPLGSMGVNARTGAILQGPAPAQVCQKLHSEAVSDRQLQHVVNFQSFKLQRVLTA